MDRYIAWTRETALPLWADAGFDPVAGRFHERLDGDARPLAVPHRAMVQARQIFVYAHAAALGWFPDGAALAERAFATLRRDFCSDDGTVVSVAYAIDPASGAVQAAGRDSYTHAFVLFALSQLYALNGDRAVLALAQRVTAFLERDMIDTRHGGLIDAIPGPATKRQNPQMHLLEAYLALDAAAPGRGYRERADRLVALFYDRMASPRTGVLLEHFSDRWGAHPDPAMAAVFEPGHHYEWIWLLDRHERASGQDHAGWRARLRDAARGDGHHAGGLIFDEVRADRTVSKPGHRLWPHTEAIKAATVDHRNGDANALAFARTMADLLYTHFLDAPFVGGWTDQIAAGHAPTVDYVPASSLYHIVLAATEAAAAFTPRPMAVSVG